MFLLHPFLCSTWSDFFRLHCIAWVLLIKCLLHSPLRISLPNHNSYCMHFLLLLKSKVKRLFFPKLFLFWYQIACLNFNAAFFALGAETFVYSAECWQHWCSFPSRAPRCAWSLTLKEAVSTCSLMLLEKLPANMEVRKGYWGSCNISSRMKWKKCHIHVRESTK